MIPTISLIVCYVNINRRHYTSSLITAEDLEYSAGRIADWIQEQFELTNEILSGDGQSVLRNWAVNVYTDTPYKFLVDPLLKFGDSAGTAAGSPITFGSIALAATEETFRLANFVAIGSAAAAYLKGSSFLNRSSGIVNAAEGLPDAYAGVKQASQYLQDMGVSRADRVKILQSFDVSTISVNMGSLKLAMKCIMY